MVVKLKMKIWKKSHKCSYIVIGYNKKKKTAKYIEKVGLIIVRKQKKYVFLNQKKINFWLNKGVIINSYISSFLSHIVYGILMHRKKKNVKISKKKK
jgi:ribosomal protein S16